MSAGEPNDRRHLGVGLLVGGVVLTSLAASVDALGLSANLGFGWKQTAGVVLGIIVAAAGLAMLRGCRPDL